MRNVVKRDYYEVLGLRRDATLEEIKTAFRRAAKECHPDVARGNPRAEEAFKECAEAYDVLSDPRKRQLYDVYGYAGLERNGFSGFSQVTIEDLFQNFPFADLLGDFFGMGGFTGRTRSRPRGPQMTRGADLRYDLELSLEEAAKGKKLEIELEAYIPCERCQASGSADGKSDYSACPNCGGTGAVSRSAGFFAISSPCKNCEGSGYVLSNPCRKCNGEGRVFANRSLKVDIPIGIDGETRIRLAGEGEVGRLGGPAGDLYIFVHLREHKLFKLSGDDLHFGLEVSFAQAALGDRLQVPTLESATKMDLPAGTQSGDVVRVKGEGFPHLHGRGQGDLLVHIKVVTPKKLSKEQKELYQRLRNLEKEKR
jgi:molecular chaperone DnaJ